MRKESVYVEGVVGGRDSGMRKDGELSALKAVERVKGAVQVAFACKKVHIFWGVRCCSPSFCEMGVQKSRGERS